MATWNPPVPKIPEGFTAWNGDEECPVPHDTTVDQLYTSPVYPAGKMSEGCRAGIMDWKNVISYRVIRPATVMVKLDYSIADHYARLRPDISPALTKACRKALGKETE